MSDGTTRALRCRTCDEPFAATSSSAGRERICPHCNSGDVVDVLVCPVSEAAALWQPIVWGGKSDGFSGLRYVIAAPRKADE